MIGPGPTPQEDYLYAIEALRSKFRQVHAMNMKLQEEKRREEERINREKTRKILSFSKKVAREIITNFPEKMETELNETGSSFVAVWNCNREKTIPPMSDVLYHEFCSEGLLGLGWPHISLMYDFVFELLRRWGKKYNLRVSREESGRFFYVTIHLFEESVES